LSEWNDTITEGLYNGAHEAFLEMKFLLNIIRWNVPGSLNLFMAAKKCYKLKMLMLIAIGCVFKGKHFDFVEGVTQGIKDLNVQRTFLLFCVLTDNTMQQSIDRSGGIHGNKGTSCYCCY
jgi:6,7-dimethyl-8-ribityllumazine synthase